MKHALKWGLLLMCCAAVLIALPATRAAAQTPGALMWHTYMGGKIPVLNSTDRCQDMAMDEAGYLYVVGSSVSPWNTTDVPVNPHNANADNIGWELNRDVFVAKLDQNGSVIWHTFLGTPIHWWGEYYKQCTGSDEGFGIAVDGNGNVYVSGASDYSWGSPIVPYFQYYAYHKDAFLAKLDAGTGVLEWNTFMGVQGHDVARGLDVDAAGNIYVTGQSPYSWGTPLNVHHGGYGGDILVAKFDPSGNRIWNTFLGGTNGDIGYDLKLDANGDIFIAGQTALSFTTPPVWIIMDPVNPGTGGNDALAAKLNSSGQLQWYTLHGGTNPGYDDYDIANGISLDESNGVYITGHSRTPWGTPVSGGGGWADVFAAKLNKSDGVLQWNTFFGSNMTDEGNAVDVGENGHIFITGQSYSYWGSWDAIVSELDNGGNLLWRTLLFSEQSPSGGGGGIDKGYAVVAGNDGTVFIAGYSQNQWGTPLNPHSGPGAEDVLLARLCTASSVTNSPPELTVDASAVTTEEGQIVLNCGTVTDPDNDFVMLFSSPGTIINNGDGTWSWSLQTALGDVGTQTVAVAGDDGNGGTAEISFTVTITPVNTPPVLTIASQHISVVEGATAAAIGTVTDPDGDVVSLTASIGDITDNGDGTWSWSFQTSDGPAESQQVTITADDGKGGTAGASTNLVVANAAPVVASIVLPLDPTAMGDQPVTVTAGFSDAAGLLDAPFTCSVDYGDGSGPEAAVVDGFGLTGPDHTFALAGVYTITVSVTDKDGGIGTVTATEFIVIYDPAEGFVTGGGWIDSPEGACPDNVTLAGKACFGFVSKYKKGQTTPDGNTQFQFKAGQFEFKSTSYEWLIIAAAKAMYKGEGTVNEAGHFGFQVSAIDADLTPSTDADLFRIRIWNIDLDDALVYDNKVGETDVNADPTTALGGGNIKIHKTGLGKALVEDGPIETENAVPGEFMLSQNYPNPFNPTTNITYNLPEGEHHVRLSVFNILGKEIYTLIDQEQTGGAHSIDFDASGLASGLYFYRLSIPGSTRTRKMYLGK
ncbi:SBBP repeat-containing protein [bacterium]|nr:SBBP repeat-containing protein [bacterium]